MASLVLQRDHRKATTSDGHQDELVPNYENLLWEQYH